MNKNSKIKKTFIMSFGFWIVILWIIFWFLYYKTTFLYAKNLCESKVKENVSENIDFWEIKASNNLKQNHEYPFTDYFREKVREWLWKDDFSYWYSIMGEFYYLEEKNKSNYYCICVDWKIVDFSISKVKLSDN